MKGAVFVVFNLCVFIIQGRLIGKSENKTDVEEKKSTITQRANRDTSEGSSLLMGFSKFESIYNAENKKTKSNHTVEKNITKNKKNATNNSGDDPPEVKKELVKRPIPKFNDINYEDDFDSEIFLSKIPLTSLNEIDHEDEDFDLDDYDFDVNHDEFAGRGKPLEPRKKFKDIHDELKKSPTYVSKSQNKFETRSEKDSKKQSSESTSKREKQPIKFKRAPAEATAKLEDTYEFTGENFERIVRTLNA